MAGLRFQKHGNWITWEPSGHKPPGMLNRASHAYSKSLAEGAKAKNWKGSRKPELCEGTKVPVDPRALVGPGNKRDLVFCGDGRPKTSDFGTEILEGKHRPSKDHPQWKNELENFHVWKRKTMRTFSCLGLGGGGIFSYGHFLNFSCFQCFKIHFLSQPMVDLHACPRSTWKGRLPASVVGCNAL